jgi:hypothetical protein
MIDENQKNLLILYKKMIDLANLSMLKKRLFDKSLFPLIKSNLHKDAS